MYSAVTRCDQISSECDQLSPCFIKGVKLFFGQWYKMCPKCVHNVSKFLDTLWTHFGNIIWYGKIAKMCPKCVQSLDTIWTHFVSLSKNTNWHLSWDIHGDSWSHLMKSETGSLVTFQFILSSIGVLLAFFSRHCQFLFRFFWYSIYIGIFGLSQ